MKTLHFSLLQDCNENCLFCAKEVPSGGTVPLRECLRVLAKKRSEGYDRVYFDGGEPSLRPDLPALARAALLLGYKTVRITTNGVLFADGKLAQKLAACHPLAKKRLGVCVSLHSDSRKISEELTGSGGTFVKTAAGIDSLLRLKIPVSLYHVITAKNYRRLPRFSRFVLRRFGGVGGVTFSHIFPGGRADAGLYPGLGPAAPKLKKAVELLTDSGVHCELAACGMIPFCLLSGMERLAIPPLLGDNSANSLVVGGRKEEPFPFSTAGFNSAMKTKPSSCRRCAADKICGGIWKAYARRFGLNELKPLRLPPAAKKKVFRLPRSAAGMSRQELLLRLFDARLGGFGKTAFPSGRFRARPDFALIADFAARIFKPCV